MGRPLRPIANGLIYHALNRGNNRAPVWEKPDDYAHFLQILRQTRERYPFQLYGYCLMPNHFHLLIQPGKGQSISRIIQSLTVAHTWWFHRQQGSVGHVWQGRFKSPVIQNDEHLLTVLRYIEANPLRAKLVSTLEKFPWSSYGVHGLGQVDDDLVAPLPIWETLGLTEKKRQTRWRKLVNQPVKEAELERLRKSVTSGRPFGSSAWEKRIATRLGINLEPRPRGRPRKDAEK